jgi:FMN hydrolase / 5-amino-6-(5-phospho-D-ribitylamino)uracil phosphatase
VNTIGGVTPADITVVFDGDQTLWDFASAMVRALGETRIEIARSTGLPVTEIPPIEELVAVRQSIDDRIAAGESVVCPRRLAFADTLRRLGQDPSDDLVDHITDFFIGRRVEMCRPYLEAVPTLTLLRESYAIALLTNAPARLDRIGLREFFDHIFCGDDFGSAKPDPTLYAHVRAMCDSKLLVSVGDSLDDDIVGPQAAGWRAVWINRDGAPLPDTVHPDAVLTSLGGLDTALKTIAVR